MEPQDAERPPIQSPQITLKPSDPASPDFMSKMIPDKNGAALLSYYLGLVSIFPLLGLPIAIVALVQGRKGVRNARENPEIRGKTHAYVGIGCGLCGLVLNLILTAALIYALSSTTHR